MDNDREKDREEIFKAHLTALFFQFKDKPHLLANYFSQHDALKETFKDRIVNNSKLKDISENMKNNQELDKPYFHNLEEMQKYYNQLFEKEKEKESKKVHPVLGASTKEEALKVQLQEALDSEDYEKAAKLRDYMKQLGIDF
jgi:excinuclease UvrABC helicase subunit UvrB